MEAVPQTSSVPAPSAAAPDDPSLLEQLAQRDQQIAALSAQLAAGNAAVPQPTSKLFHVELYWRTATTDFAADAVVRVDIPQTDDFRTYYLELPSTTGDFLRLDLGNEPAVWLIDHLRLHAVSPEGALVDPPLITADNANGYAGLRSIRGILLGRHTLGNTTPVCRVLCWDEDPQLGIALPREIRAAAETRRILALRCRVVDPVRLLMEQSVPGLFAQSGELEAQVATLQQQRETLQAAVHQLEHVKNSRAYRFTRPLSRLYHGMFPGQMSAPGSAGG